MPHRGDARRGARTGDVRHRHARGRPTLRPGDLEHRAPGRTRVPHGLQSAALARVGRRVNTSHEWLSVHHGTAPLVVSFPHTGTEIPDPIESLLVSPWFGRKDADLWVDVLYDF